MTPCPVMYCTSCQDILTAQCLLIDTHRRHRWKTLKDAETEQLEHIKQRCRKLESKVMQDGMSDIERQVSAAKCKIEDMYTKTRELINGQYEKLWKLLENNEKYARFLLEAERESQQRSLNQLEEDADNYQSKTDKMLEDLQKLRKQQKTENRADQLDELMALEINLETIEEFCSSMKGKTFDDARLRALEASIKNIIQNSKELLPRPWEFSETLTFDKNRTGEQLKVSEDASQIFLKRFSTNQLKNYKTPWFSTVASQSFSKGQHYWEVEVEGGWSWAVGIVEKSWRVEKGENQLTHPLVRDRASWVLESNEGELTALHKGKSSPVRDCRVNRLGVYVDCDKDQVKIYNVSDGRMLHSFSARLKKPVCPAFSLKATSSSTARLKLCKITKDNQHPLRDVQTGDWSDDSGAYAESEETSEQSQ